MKPLLLSPAGDKACLNAAIKAGCDAVYLGLSGLNMRATAKNFQLNELTKIVSLCHDNGVKVFLTLNTIIFEDELCKVAQVLDRAKKAKVDVIITWDLSVIRLAKKRGLKVNISTQASISNSDTANEYVRLGADSITLAREVTLKQLKVIREKVNVPIEVFVHGAMCVALSGRCFISQFLFGRSANCGDCLQPCRREYRVIDKETGDELELGDNFVMSPKDLCTIGFLDKLIDAGADIFKIEGRSRSPEYVYTVTKAYREAIDAYEDGKLDDKLKRKLLGKLSKVYNRGFSAGFYIGRPINEFTDSYGSKATEKKIFVGLVKNYYSKVGVAEVLLQSDGLKVGDNVLVTGNTTGVVRFDVESMQINGKDVDVAKKGIRIGLRVPEKLRVNDKVFVMIQR